jgi:hypothetical protein
VVQLGAEEAFSEGALLAVGTIGTIAMCKINVFLVPDVRIWNLIGDQADTYQKAMMNIAYRSSSESADGITPCASVSQRWACATDAESVLDLHRCSVHQAVHCLISVIWRKRPQKRLGGLAVPRNSRLNLVTV